MKKDIICIGHITKDRIATPTTEVFLPGGTTFYCAYGFNSLQSQTVSFELIASLAEEDMKTVEDMRQKGIDVRVIPSRKTVFFENIYGENTDERQQRVRAKADPFSVQSVENVEAQYIILGSLLADDFPMEVIQYLSTRGTLVVDAQGFLREVRGEEVFAIDWKDKLEALKYIDILKVNEHEILTLTGIEDQKTACRKLAEWGVKEVLLTLGSHGSIVLADGVFYEIPAYTPHKTVDATGCGDTYVMGYIYQRVQGASVEEAGNFASAIASLKLEASGPFSGSEADVQARLTEPLRQA